MFSCSLWERNDFLRFQQIARGPLGLHWKKMQRATSSGAVSVVPSVAPTPLMKEGELVILYCGRENIVPLTLKSNAIFRNKHGEFRHNDMIGKPIGSRVRCLSCCSSSGRTF